MLPLKRKVLSLLSQYSVEIASLELGNHQFNFQIKKTFFDDLAYSELEDGDFSVKLKIEKKERMLLLNFDISGIVHVNCDRCTDNLDITVKTQHQLILKYGSTHEDDEDDVVFIRESENEFNIASFVYEFIILALPYKLVHGDDENGVSFCNKEFMKTFSIYQSNASNDDRWEKLKNMNKN